MNSAPALTPKKLVLDLLATARDRAMPVRALTAAGELFSIEPGSVRVALARLCRRGLVSHDERGAYSLGQAASAVTSRIGSWRQAEDQTTNWNGDWLMVARNSGDAGDRSRARRSRRALALFGFVEFRAAVWIRPDNLIGGVEAARRTLLDLGLDPESAVAVLNQLSADDRIEAEGLWESLELEHGYLATLKSLDNSLARIERLSFEESLAETYLVGADAVRTIVFDPMLPDPLVDVSTRRALLAAVVSYDRLGRKMWANFMGRYGVSTDASPLEATTRLSSIITAEH